MTVINVATQIPFTTKDGSAIRSILDRSNAPVQNQSLAEASLPAETATRPHLHRASEEFYFILEGHGQMTLGTEIRDVHPGDAILIPPGQRHAIRARTPLRFLCCCAPPYSHEDTYFD
ncbi:MAG TPA: cupin domain-containing protein [Verrucomicrobiae bacterium]|nr:cupin domain-containing protein [Verrucomicrobiae bacterium]